MNINIEKKRYTTCEVAQKLDSYPSDVLRLLKAAKIHHEKCGPAFLWDGEEVDRLLAAIAGEAAQ